MDISDLLRDGFERVRQTAHGAIEGLSEAQLTYRVDGRANSIAWLVWHLARIQDDHVAEVAGTEQAWTSQGWAGRFGLPFDPAATGFGQSASDVAMVRPDAGLLAGYLDAVHEQSVRYVGTLAVDDLDRIVDDRWDPPVTLGVRLVSVLADDLQHAGQAAFIRGLQLA